MTRGRDPLTELQAIAAMPGLEPIAEAIGGECGMPAERIVPLLVYTAMQFSLASRDQLTSFLAHKPIWDEARKAAEAAGRELPAKSPTHDMLRHLRDRLPRIGAVAAQAFVPAMRELVIGAGLLVPSQNRCHRPARANTVYGDGSVFKPHSAVTVDPETGVAERSRSKTGRPRVGELFLGKHGTSGYQDPGLPICVLGVHGGPGHGRAVLAVSLFTDRNEIGSAMGLFEQVHAIYGSGVHGFVYDKLMSGCHMQQVMHCGVVPIVDMPNAATSDHLAVPADLQVLLGSRAQPKERAVLQYIETVEHHTGRGVCRHSIWALDGGLITSATDDPRPSWDSPVLEQSGSWFEPGPGGQALMARYRVPCRDSHHFEYVFDHSGNRGGARGTALAVADWVRPIPRDVHSELSGARSDVESVFATAKRKMDGVGRAHSLRSDHFLLDMIGFALGTNAVLWDVHVGRYTNHARRAARSAAVRNAG